MFFYVSLVLVIVAAVTLVIGLLSSGLPLVIVSIASSALAGIFLILTVVRERPAVEEAGEPAPLAQPPVPVPLAAARSDEFPIADYDDLRVSEVLPLLPELDPDELELVRDRETSGKARASVLGRIDELLSEREEEVGEELAVAPAVAADDEFPIADYDDLRVNEIVPLLPELDPDELEIVRDREQAGKARASVLGRIDELLGAEAPAPAKPAPAKKPAAAKPAAKKAPAKKPAAAKPAAKPVAKKAPAKKPAAAKPAAKPAPAKKSPGKKASDR